MTFQTLVPTSDPVDGAGLDITALLATPTDPSLRFSNTGRERLYILSSDGVATVTVDVLSTVLGRTVANFAAVTPAANHVVMFGEFHAALDIPGTTTVQVVLSTVTNVTVALLQSAGVY